MSYETYQMDFRLDVGNLGNGPHSKTFLALLSSCFPIILIFVNPHDPCCRCWRNASGYGGAMQRNTNKRWLTLPKPLLHRSSPRHEVMNKSLSSSEVLLFYFWRVVISSMLSSQLGRQLQCWTLITLVSSVEVLLLTVCHFVMSSLRKVALPSPYVQYFLLHQCLSP